MRRIGLVLSIVAVPLLGGCYERVVSARGMGAQGVTVTHPNSPDDSKATSTQRKTVKLKEAPSRW
ncbi:MAG: hypothetical protein KF678_06650 [Phycisphaeraceae bacterium]|jgi:hypothetical protein|nr:hypothetical protein [Phycisphaeraceae bacterium]